MRRDPTSPPALERIPNNKIATEVRHYQLITPLFGGGVTPAQADPVTVVRGTEIRGHLRFWWRACRGGQSHGSLADMKRAEDTLWGAPSSERVPTEAPVSIRVDVTNRGAPLSVTTARGETVHVSHFRSPYSYGAFPLADKPQSDLLVGIEFDLTLTYPQERAADVQAALWAWETFGGLGARTRRGFGALCCTQVDQRPLQPPAPDKVIHAVREGLQQHVVGGGWPDQVPHLDRDSQFKVTRPQRDTLYALQDLLQALKNFRQQRNPGTGSNRPGRSKWPEPDAIRRLTGRRAPLHATALSQIDKFPRAVFGLPIIFHFKDARAGDPEDTTLRGVTSDRLASPLILRPLLCMRGAGVGLALVLNAPRTDPAGLILRTGSTDRPVDETLTVGEARTIAPLRGQTDVLEAFLQTL